MKIVKIFTVIALTALLVVGWGTYVGKKIPSNPTYDADIEMAEQWVEEGLYQRAILKYKEILPYESTEDIWTKMLNAYELRYAEDTSILSDYITQLNTAISIYPKNVAFVQKLYELHLVSNDYTRAYACLESAINSGVTDETILAEARRLKYSYQLNYDTYAKFESLSMYTYAVTNGVKWGCVNATGDKQIDFNYPYVSSVSAEGVRIYDTSLGSRLIDNTGLVLGIFSFQVQDSGIYSEGLIPVLCDGQYNYYDSFAKEQFGGYEFAGTFQKGLAAVKKNEEWRLIDKTGNEKSDKFADIVTDSNGCYLLGSVMVAATESGTYQLFDKDGKIISDFAASNMDICMGDGWIAYKKDGKWGFVDSEGNVKMEPQYECAKSFSNGLAAVCENGSWGFINMEGEVVIDYQFADADYFNAYGACMVRTDVPNVDDEVLWQLLILNFGV